jgi:DNA polymerase IV
MTPALDPHPTRPRRIAHLDMDAFYASVELLRRPELRGQPVAIGGRAQPDGSVPKRGVVTTANYEARAYGVHSAMSLHIALEKCPQLVVLPVDFGQYRLMSRRFKQAVLEIAPVMEDRGIDEVYLDLSEIPGVEEQHGEALARRLQQAVFEATQLTCSIGLAPNKLLAKIASDFRKPGGLTRLEIDDLPKRLWPLPVRKLHGVGPKSEQRLQGLGLGTIGDLAAAEPALLQEVFGARYGRWLYDAAHGLDDRPVVTHSDPISRSRETTFGRDLHPRHDWTLIARTLDELTQELCADLDRRAWVGRNAGVKVRFDDFRIVTRDVGLREPSNDFKAVRRAAFEALARIDPQRRIRLIGVRVGGLLRSVSVEDKLRQPRAAPGSEPASQCDPGLQLSLDVSNGLK